jgi:hypothetical protein
MKRIFIFLFFSGTLYSQNSAYYNDAQVRFNLGLEAKITKKFSITLDQQDRWTKNVSEFRRASFDLGISYKLNKYIRLKADYVFIQKKNKYDYFYSRNWFYAAVFLKYEYKRWRFIDRNLFQVRMGNMNSPESSVMRYYYRNKLSIKYELTKRYDVFVAEEIYIPLNSPQAQGIERTRSYLGLSIKTFRGQAVELYFMYQAYLQKDNWFKQKNKYDNDLLRRDYIYGINYQIEF